jgi:hypothetical protein
LEPDDAKTGPLLSCRTASAEADIEEQDPVYGHVQHLGSAADVLEMVKREWIIWNAHPRTKNSELYPNGYKNKDCFLSDSFVSASWEPIALK